MSLASAHSAPAAPVVSAPVATPAATSSAISAADLAEARSILSGAQNAQTPASPVPPAPEFPPTSTVAENPGDVPPVDVPGVTPAGAADPADALRTQLAALSDAIGYDFSAYKSLEDAQRTAQMLVHEFASYEPEFNLDPPSAEPAPQAPAASEDDGLGDLDPRIAERLRSLENRLQEQTARNNQLQQRQSAEIERQVLARAEAALDSMQSGRYGTGDKATVPQGFARQNVLRIADRLIDGIAARKRPMPTIEKIINMAVMLDTQQIPTLAAAGGGAQVPPAAPDAGPAVPPAQMGGRIPIAPNLTPERRPRGDESDLYLGDGDFMRGARAILSR